MADTTISALSRILTTNTGAIVPITVDGVTAGIPVSGIITATGDKGGGFTIPTGTTAQRPASPVQGTIRYNTSVSALEIYTSTGWWPLAFNSNAGNAPVITPTKLIYDFIGTDVSFTVPSLVTSLNVKVWGGAGSSVGPLSPGGGGGFVGGTLAVTPGQTLIISVGGGASSTHVGGYNGGGDTGGPSYNKLYGSGGGGGYSGIFLNSKTFNNSVIIAGGGGAGGYDQDNDGLAGGPGGGSVGGDSVQPSGSWNASGGKGGTQSAGGIGGQGVTGIYAGSQLLGGRGQPDGGYGTGGGGGGGYYGGGGGYGYYRTVASGGGGGGSGYFNPSIVTNVTSLQGDSALLRTGNPANLFDTDRGTAGQGGKGINVAGTGGRIVISYYPQ